MSRPSAVTRIAGFEGLIAKLRLRSILSQCSSGRERKASLTNDGRDDEHVGCIFNDDQQIEEQSTRIE